MTEQIVDLLETIEVDHQEAERVARVQCVPKRKLQLATKQPPVRQRGGDVVRRRMPDLLDNLKPGDCRADEVGIALEEACVPFIEGTRRAAVDLEDPEGNAVLGPQDDDAGNRLHAVILDEIGILE